MTGKFEEYIVSQSPHLDVESPDDEKVWKGISAELGETRRLRMFLLSAAAVAIILITSAVTITFIIKQRKAPEPVYSLLNVSKQLGEEENYFRLTVDKKMNEVKRSGADAAEYTEMMDQLEQIDKQYETYKTDLQELGSQPKILKGIIRCYEMKIRVIEKTLNEIEKKNHDENEKHIL
jgi:tetrahydromethanopterin S-methyltransferase subunit G